jgi:hypothetical protein
MSDQNPSSAPPDVKNRMRQMAAADQMSAADADRLFEAGVTLDTVEKAKMHGINFFMILQWVNTYGPIAVNVLRDILNYIKPLAPPLVTGEKK